MIYKVACGSVWTMRKSGKHGLTHKQTLTRLSQPGPGQTLKLAAKSVTQIVRSQIWQDDFTWMLLQHVLQHQVNSAHMPVGHADVIAICCMHGMQGLQFQP